MTPFKVTSSIIAVVGAATIYLWTEHDATNRAPAMAKPALAKPALAKPALVSAPAKEGRSSTSAPPVARSSRISTPINYRKIFAESHNFWDFAHEILPAAKSGDADAQFYLSKVLDFCSENNKWYFEVHGKAIGLDEGLQVAAERHQQGAIVQSIFERCHQFQEQSSSELGSARDWLAMATEAGHAAAQATTAQKMLAQEMAKNFLNAGAAETPENTAPAIGNGAEPRDLMLAAVKSRDPEALFAIGWAQGFLNQPNEDKGVNRAAWMLVACQRGFDCSAGAEWVAASCPSCDAGSAESLMQTISGDKWPAVQQRAQEINAKLDAAQWNELGLGS